MPLKDPEARKKYNREYRLAHLEEYKQRDREYRETHAGEIYERNKKYVENNLEKHRAWCRKGNAKWRQAHPEQWSEILSKYDREFPERRAAMRLVHKAMRKGELIRPDHCVFCGRPCKPHAHHNDYENPLEVVWLCSPCHKLADQKRASRENSN